MAERSTLEFIYSHWLIRFNISTENNAFALTAFKKSTFQKSKKKSNLNALGSKFDLDVK